MTDIMAVGIFKCIFLNKMMEFRLKFHRNMFSRVQTLTSIDSGNGLTPKRRQAITWSDDDPVHWRIYAALGRDAPIKQTNELFMFRNRTTGIPYLFPIPLTRGKLIVISVAEYHMSSLWRLRNISIDNIH